MLTDINCRKAKSGEKDRKLFDAGWLFLLIRPTGSKLWRMRCRFTDKEKDVLDRALPCILTDSSESQTRCRIADAARGGDPGFAGEHVSHGWRANFSTIMNERAALENQERDSGIIDLTLAHTQPGTEPIYTIARPTSHAVARSRRYGSTCSCKTSGLLMCGCRNTGVGIARP
ncbi:Arm DNA-binding domain-containing protein [Novosphingobium sp. BW1]|uniref:Arm DNA-binding domain-containing protein n=1 Tax=Novosphingobium sp. BW1 TaxID=2592621 RepID=UPI0019681B4A|nr:Arm DNA-binding domain-containing protein [Novosphingobium sp. BW1]